MSSKHSKPGPNIFSAFTMGVGSFSIVAGNSSMRWDGKALTIHYEVDHVYDVIEENLHVVISILRDVIKIGTGNSVETAKKLKTDREVILENTDGVVIILQNVAKNGTGKSNKAARKLIAEIIKRKMS